MQIAKEWREEVRASWRRRDGHLYGRFDLRFDGHPDHPAQLYEYNADTPTTLVEASVMQWHWFRDTWGPDGADGAVTQFNGMHTALIERWRQLEIKGPLYVASEKSLEDYCTVNYLLDAAEQSGAEVGGQLFMETIGFREGHGYVTPAGETITNLFKVRSLSCIHPATQLYPWEWLSRERFAAPYLALPPERRPRLIEPAWKSVLSNKGILAVLWEMFPGHPNLIPSFFEPGPLNSRYVSKPLYGREGENIHIRSGESTVWSDGVYDTSGQIYQAPCLPPDFNGWRCVVGSWVVGDEAAGLGLREDRTVITGNESRFVPHVVVREGRTVPRATKCIKAKDVSLEKVLRESAPLAVKMRMRQLDEQKGTRVKGLPVASVPVVKSDEVVTKPASAVVKPDEVAKQAVPAVVKQDEVVKQAVPAVVKQDEV